MDPKQRAIENVREAAMAMPGDESLSDQRHRRQPQANGGGSSRR